MIHYALLIAALIQVESGGNDAAVGDGGVAVGCLQITPVFVEEVNRVYGTCFTLDDRLDRERSITMAHLWLMRQAQEYYRRTGKPATEEILARIYRLGLAGHLREPWEAEGYWRRVSACMAAEVEP